VAGAGAGAAGTAGGADAAGTAGAAGVAAGGTTDSGDAEAAATTALAGDAYDPVKEAIARSERERTDELRAREAEAARLQAEREAAAERERRGRIETAANSVKIDEDERLQTLDGALPAVLSIDEKGHFAFDRYDLAPDVRGQLDVIAERLKDAPYDKLYIVGYTDRIGTEEYNRKLSEKRAWSVAGYLMDRGVPPYKLKVEGRGEAGSITTVNDCQGLRREALIECLQRDRRVEVVATVKEYNIKVQ
jgi:outer membrane protein OmpA-like peptidoglycan-associated protein